MLPGLVVCAMNAARAGGRSVNPTPVTASAAPAQRRGQPAARLRRDRLRAIPSMSSRAAGSEALVGSVPGVVVRLHLGRRERVAVDRDVGEAALELVAGIGR